MSVPDGEGGRVDKWYALAMTEGRCTRKMLGQSISQKTLVNGIDVIAVMEALGPEIIAKLLEGQLVELPPLGSFRLSVHNHGGAATKSAWKPSLIKGGYIVFTPYDELRLAALHAHWTRWHNPEEEALLRHAYEAEQKVKELEMDILYSQKYADKTAETAQAMPEDKLKEAIAKAAQAHLDELNALLGEAQEAANKAQSIVGNLMDAEAEAAAADGLHDHTDLHL
jgi:nucleoid DNA-binding protein